MTVEVGRAPSLRGYGAAIASTLLAIGSAFSSCASPAPLEPTCPEGMAYVQGGPFQRGAPAAELSLSSLALELGFVPLEPQWSWVDSFCMDRYEYPNRQGAMPMALVSYSQATAYCLGQDKRLCAEAEFDRACGGGEGWHQPYGVLEEPGRCNNYAVAEIGTEMWVAPSGAFEGCMNPEGIYDLEGNLSEWVSWDDESVSEWEVSGERLVRGGTMWWAIYGSGCHSRHLHTDPGPTHLDDGFRCCKTPAPPPIAEDR